MGKMDFGKNRLRENSLKVMKVLNRKIPPKILKLKMKMLKNK
jgi:hypothetical protein